MLLFLAITTALAQESTPVVKPPDAKTIRQQLDRARDAEINRLALRAKEFRAEAEARDKQQKTTPRNKARRLTITRLKAEAEQLRAAADSHDREIEALQDGSQKPPFPLFKDGEDEPGKIGYFRSQQVKVEDILSDDSMVIRLSLFYMGATDTGLKRIDYDSNTRYLLRGVDTSKLVEDRYTEIDGMFWISGKQRHRARTVFVVDKIDISKILADALEDPKSPE